MPLEPRFLFSNPSWLTAADTAASWNPSDNTLAVTGPATITADPGSDDPTILADGPAAQVLIALPNPTGTEPNPIHLGGLSLTNGASMEVETAGSVLTTRNNFVLVLGTSGATAAPLFNIDPSSTLDLTDNDLIDFYGNGTSPFATLQSDIERAADGGAWDQPGLTSSVAADNAWLCGLGYAEASTLGVTAFDGLPITVENAQGQTVAGGAVVIKYTLLGDTQLRGSVGIGDYDAVLHNLGSGTDWTHGNFHYAGVTGFGDYDNILNNWGASVFATADLPRGLLATPDAASPQTSLDLSWQEPNDPSGTTYTYGVYSGPDDGNGSELTAVDSSDITWTSATSCTVSGLTPGTLNYFSVYATGNSSGNGNFSSTRGMYTQIATPTATVSTDGTQVALACQDASSVNPSTLTYTWLAEQAPAGAPDPTISGSGTAASATLAAAGDYEFAVVITDSQGNFVSAGEVPVSVSQIPASLTISPSSASLTAGESQQFTVSGTDQFGNPLDTSAATWSVAGSDAGAIDSTGDYTAPTDTGGSFAVDATVGTTSAPPATATVQPPTAPTITQPASFTQPTPTVVSLTMTATSIDPISYSWQQTSGPGGAAFAPDLETTNATLTAAGTYVFLGTATDETTGLSTTSSITVPVQQVATSITVTPGPTQATTIIRGFTEQFSATEFDQFGDTMATQPTFAWSVADPNLGTVSSNGEFFAPDENVGTTAVLASNGTVVGAAPEFIYSYGSGYEIGTSESYDSVPIGAVVSNQNPQVTYSSPDGVVTRVNANSTALEATPSSPGASSEELDAVFTNPVNDLSINFSLGNPAWPGTQDLPEALTVQVYTNGALAQTLSCNSSDGFSQVDLESALWACQDVTSIQVVADNIPSSSNHAAIFAPASFEPVNIGVALGNGSPNQILQASDDGMQHLVPLDVFVPPDVPDGTQLTLTTTAPSEVDLWDTANPIAGQTPLPCTDDPSTTSTWTVGEGSIPSLYVGATQASQTTGDIKFTLSAILPGATSSSPSQPTSTTQPATAIDPEMQVATILDNNASGTLPQSQMASPGAYIPLDNNDWDYDVQNNNGTPVSVPDLAQTGAIQGDQYLLPITLPAIPGASANDGYLLTPGNGLSVWLNNDRTGVASSSLIPANVSHTVYLEATAEGGHAGPSKLTASLILGGSTYALKPLTVNVFRMDGPLDVPGGGTYEYSTDAATGSWATPSGGTIASQAGGPGDYDAKITWAATADVGYAEFAASPAYTWGDGVNVVKVSTTSSYFDGGNSVQQDPNPKNYSQIWSSLAGNAMSLTVGVTLQGPTLGSGGVMRGVEFISVGLVQNARTTQDSERLANNTVLTSSLQSTTWLLDADGSKLPWFRPSMAGSFDPANANSTQTVPEPLYISDIPSNSWYQPWFNQVSVFNSLFDFRDFVLATTTADPLYDTPYQGYADIAEGSWYFNASGLIDAQKGWHALPSAFVGGDATLSDPTVDTPTTTGVLANSTTGGATWS